MPAPGQDHHYYRTSQMISATDISHDEAYIISFLLRQRAPLPRHALRRHQISTVNTAISQGRHFKLLASRRVHLIFALLLLSARRHDFFLASASRAAG